MYVVLCGLTTLVIIINLGLFAAWRNRKPDETAKIWKAFESTSKAPWGKEDEDLKQLSGLVGKLSENSTKMDDRKN